MKEESPKSGFLNSGDGVIIIRAASSYGSLIVLVIGILALGIGLSMPGSFVTIERPFELSMLFLLFGLLTGLFGLILPPIMGWISDKTDRKNIIVSALLLYTVVSLLFTILLYPVMSLAELTFTESIVSVLSSMFWPAAYASLAAAVSRDHRGMAFGLGLMVWVLAPSTAVIIGAPIACILGSTAVFYSSSLIILFGALLTLTFVRKPEQAMNARNSEPEHLYRREDNSNQRSLEMDSKKDKQSPNNNHMTSLTQRLGSKIIIALIITYASIRFIVSWTNIAIFQSIWLYDFSASVIYDIVDPLLVVLSALGLLSGGILADLYHRKDTLVRILGVGSIFCIAILLTLGAMNATLFLIMVAVFFFILNLAFPSVFALIADTTESSRWGVIYGFLIMCSGIGMILLDLLLAPAILGFNTTLSFFCIATALVVLTTILVQVGVEEQEEEYD